jgi:hypothetical protein
MKECNPAIRVSILCCAIAATAFVTGCATPASSSNMTLREADVTQARARTPAGLKGSIAIRDVTGGQETNPMWKSNVSSSAFEQALEDSLRSVGMLAADRQGGRYQLVAQLDKVDQPFMGFDMTVTSTVTYTLFERATGKTVVVKTISTPYTARMGDAFAGTERLRLANEGAMRSNIAGLIEELGSAHIASVVLN